MSERDSGGNTKIGTYASKLPEGQLTKNFSKKEMACSCCGESKMDLDFIIRLQTLRELCGFTFIISSGYRCAKHNADVSSTGEQGPHTTGMACDVKVSGERAHTLLKHALRLGFTGIGISQKGPHEKRYIHVDTVNNGPRPMIWSY